MNTFTNFEVYTTVSMICSDPNLENYWLSEFSEDMELIIPTELESNVQSISKTLVFDYRPIPQDYLSRIGLSVEELEESEEVIYLQHLWLVEGYFETELDESSFLNYLNKLLSIDFAFAKRVEFTEDGLAEYENPMQIIGGDDCFALEVTSLEFTANVRTLPLGIETKCAVLLELNENIKQYRPHLFEGSYYTYNRFAFELVQSLASNFQTHIDENDKKLIESAFEQLLVLTSAGDGNIKSLADIGVTLREILDDIECADSEN